MPAAKFTTEEQKQRTKELFDQQVGAREIAKELGISRWMVQKIYKELGVYNIGRTTPRTVYLLTEKQCKTCEEIKPIGKFRKRVGKHSNGDKRISYEPYCQECIKEMESTPEYYAICKKRRLKRLAKLPPKPAKPKPQTNDELRDAVYSEATKTLRRCKYSGNLSFEFKYLPYTVQEFVEHIAGLFEPWMTWQNRGRYETEKWNDNDKSTWVWSLDHIIRQTDLPFSSINDENFKKCWSLSNLRPLSSKQNLEENHRGYEKEIANV
jgi:hypothetical protein